MNARTPLYALFAATAVEERPVLASTIYARVLVNIHLSKESDSAVRKEMKHKGN